VIWEALSDLSQEDIRAANEELGPLREVWIEQKGRLEDSGLLETFNERLVREWSIETGLLESLHTIDRGITHVLVERGFDASLIPYGTSDLPAQELIEILKDHHESARLVFEVIKNERPLSVGIIKELHALITQHQDFVDGVDQFGRATRVPLLKGEFKRLPNSPTRPDGELHEYCPPLQVASEMDRLVLLHAQHEERGIPVDVSAAWLHHRFTQIHPFQDGNGRVARAIANVVFIKAGWFPLVIRSESHRDRYIDGLESADHGNLSPLVSLFGQIEKQAFVQALGLAGTVKSEEVNLGELLSSIEKELVSSVDERSALYDQVKPVADSLLDIAIEQLETIEYSLKNALKGASGSWVGTSNRRWTDSESQFNRFAFSTAARELRYYANIDSFASWARIRITTPRGHWEILVGLHGLGTRWRGVVAGSILINQLVKDEEGPIRSENIEPSVTEIFQLNYRDDPEVVRQRFRKWLDTGLVAALQQWRSKVEE
jgi:Fic family protein